MSAPAAAATGASLHPAVESMLDRVATVVPAGATALRADLRRVLGPVAAGPWAPVGWTFSRLTGSGMPVELAFPDGDGELRATVEAAAPHVPDGDRLDAAVRAALGPAGAVTPEATRLLDDVRRLQSGGPLRWGAWAALRRRADGATGAAKVYAELPSGRAIDGRGPLARLIARWLPLLSPGGRPVCLGVRLAGGAHELYVGGAVPFDDLDRLTAACGSPGRAGELAAAVTEIGARPARLALSSRQAGWSVTLGPDAAALALHLPARVLAGGEWRVRPRLLDAAARRGWRLGAYAAATRPDAGTGSAGVPGVVSLVLAPDAPLRLQVGVRPC